MAEAQRGPTDDVVSVELPAPATWKKLVFYVCLSDSSLALF